MVLDAIWSAPGLRLACGSIAGLVAGSFLATLVARWPAGRSVADGRSRCDACGETLGIAELVPVLSFAVQRGACRRCGSPIGRSHLWMELIAAAIGGASLLASPGVDGAVGALAGWALLALAALDLGHLWLPDLLTFPLIGGAIAASVVTPAPGLKDSLIGAVGGGLSLAAVALAYRRVRGRVGLGGGDPKLFAGIGAWLGWRALPLVLLVACLFGLVAAVFLHRRGRDIEATTELPFGALLAISAWPIWLLGIPR